MAGRVRVPMAVRRASHLHRGDARFLRHNVQQSGGEYREPGGFPAVRLTPKSKKETDSSNTSRASPSSAAPLPNFGGDPTLPGRFTNLQVVNSSGQASARRTRIREPQATRHTTCQDCADPP